MRQSDDGTNDEDEGPGVVGVSPTIPSRLELGPDSWWCTRRHVSLAQERNRYVAQSGSDRMSDLRSHREAATACTPAAPRSRESRRA